MTMFIKWFHGRRWRRPARGGGLPRLALALRRKWCLARRVSISAERAVRHCRNSKLTTLGGIDCLTQPEDVATIGERVWRTGVRRSKMERPGPGTRPTRKAPSTDPI